MTSQYYTQQQAEKLAREITKAFGGNIHEQKAFCTSVLELSYNKVDTAFASGLIYGHPMEHDICSRVMRGGSDAVKKLIPLFKSDDQHQCVQIFQKFLGITDNNNNNNNDNDNDVEIVQKPTNKKATCERSHDPAIVDENLGCLRCLFIEKIERATPEMLAAFYVLFYN